MPEEHSTANPGPARSSGVLAALWRRLAGGSRSDESDGDGQGHRYKGTAPFEDLPFDRKTFFGRGRESRALLSLLLAERLVVLFAKSGLGKSSLINAGLVQPLRERGYLPVVLRLVDAERSPVETLIGGIRRAARESGVECVGGDSESLWRFFKTVEFWSEDDEFLRPVVILDQFEELFTLHSARHRREFIDQLADLVRGRAGELSEEERSLDDSPPNLKIVLALREDFLADLEELARDIPGILRHRLRLGPLSREGARTAIIEPAKLADRELGTAPFSFEEEAVEKIIDFLARRRRGEATVETDEVEPVQLQLICRYLEEIVRSRQAADGSGTAVEISGSDLGDERHMQKVLESFYDRTLASVASPLERRAVRRLCEKRLISRTGRRLNEEEDEIIAQHKISRQRLRQLVDSRLLRAQPLLGGVFYELSHDRLVEPILQSRKARVARWRRIGYPLAALVTVLIVALVFSMVRTAHQRSLLEARLGAKKVRLAADSMMRLVRDHGYDASWILSLREDEVMDEVDLARTTAVAAVLSGWETTTREVFGAALADLLAERLTPAERVKNFALMIYEVDDLGTRAPVHRGAAIRWRERIRQAFIQVTGLTPPSREEEEGLNSWVEVPGGRFLMGRLEGNPDPYDDKIERWVNLTPFRMQEHEVTNGEFSRFDREREVGPADHPLTEVDWYEAMAYAAWLGGSLPTEAQWEFAARGVEGRRFPWGDGEPTKGEHANFGMYRAPGRERGGEPLPVGGFPAGQTPEGVQDLAGSVWEWCRDWFGPYEGAEVSDPMGPEGGDYRVRRGGSCRAGPDFLRSAVRRFDPPVKRGIDIGFRVVWPSGAELD